MNVSEGESVIECESVSECGVVIYRWSSQHETQCS